jgi:hypothetical protein
MFKLAAAIRSHFVIIPYLEAKTPARRSPKPLAPTMEGARVSWPPPNVVVPRPSLASRSRLHPDEIEAMSASTSEAYSPDPSLPLLPEAGLTSLACKAPILCWQLKRMSR